MRIAALPVLGSVSIALAICGCTQQVDSLAKSRTLDVGDPKAKVLKVYGVPKQFFKIDAQTMAISVVTHSSNMRHTCLERQPMGEIWVWGYPSENSVTIRDGKVHKLSGPDADKRKGILPIHRAAIAGDIQKIEALLKTGADPNAKLKNGMTPLHCATLNGHSNIVDILVAQGADTNAVDQKGRVPADLAVPVIEGLQAKKLFPADTDFLSQEKSTEFMQASGLLD